MRTYITLLIICFVLNLSAQQKTLTAVDMQRDLHILHDAWVSLHPGLYRYNTPAGIETDFKVLQKKCASPFT